MQYRRYLLSLVKVTLELEIRRLKGEFSFLFGIKKDEKEKRKRKKQIPHFFGKFRMESKSPSQCPTIEAATFCIDFEAGID